MLTGTVTENPFKTLSYSRLHPRQEPAHSVPLLNRKYSPQKPRGQTVCSRGELKFCSMAFACRRPVVQCQQNLSKRVNLEQGMTRSTGHTVTNTVITTHGVGGERMCRNGDSKSLRCTQSHYHTVCHMQLEKVNKIKWGE